MKKENPVIKNYILSAEKRVLKDSPNQKFISVDSDILLYHEPSKQSKVFAFLFL